MKHYLAHLGELPGADEVRLALAGFLIDHGRPQEAEIELLKLVASPDRNVQAAAKDLLTTANTKTAKPSDAADVDWPRGHVDAATDPSRGHSGAKS